MTEKRPLFRPEAVEYHAKARTGGRTLDLKERRTLWLFRGLLGLVLVALTLAFAVRAETAAHGVAVVGADGDEATMTGLDPRRIEPGQDVVLDLGGREVAGTVASVESDVTTGPVVVVTLAAAAPPGARAEATVRLGSLPIAKLLLGRDD